MFRTYKRKLILNNAQEARLKSWVGACRVVYNLGLEIKKAHHSTTGKTLHKYALSTQLTELRKEVEWINDVPYQCLESTLDRLDAAYTSFFKTFTKGGGFPKFAKKGRFRSIKFKEVLQVKYNRIKLMKIGWLKMFTDREIYGTPKTATLIIEPTGFFICIHCEIAQKEFDSESQAVGLDMGISHFCIDSNGNFISNPKHFKKYERRLRIENRSLARKKKGSNSWIKQSKKLSLLHHTIGNVRRDFLHKESTKIAKLNSTVYMEDLNIKGMSANRNLSKHILDCGWGIFKTMLSYKTEVILVNPKFTSQICNECGAKDAKSRINQSEFVCTSCGHISNADINAAKNIKSQGMTLIRKREPLG